MGLKNSLILMLILNSISLVCQEKPNILWLVCEDQSLFFAPYGDSNAYTPIINQLANEVPFMKIVLLYLLCALQVEAV